MDTELDRGAFGPLLRRLRLSAGLSQEELAERARLSVEAISALERGRRRAPYRETVRLLSDGLALSAAARSELEAAARQKRPVIDRSVHYDSAQERKVVQHGSEESRRTLARPLSTFYNRHRELRDLSRLLLDFQLISIVGAGGIGKTRLALQLALDVQAQFTDGAWFVDLAPITDDALVIRSLLTTLDLKRVEGQGEADTLIGYLRQRDALIVLDNCEHVIEQIALLAQELLESCYSVRIVTTTREPLNISGERVYRIPPLESPKDSVAIDATEALTFAAVQLFVDRSQAANSAFVYSHATAIQVAAICRRLDGIALAIELAASRSAMLNPAEILTQLDEHFTIMGAGSRMTLPRQRTMHETIRWSYDRLTDVEQLVFRRSAVFVNGFTSDALASVVEGTNTNGALFAILTSLVDKSLILADTTAASTRFRILEPIRVYGLGMLESAGERSQTQRAFARWCLTFVNEVHAQWETAPSLMWAERTEPEMDNLRAALIWGLDGRHDPDLAQAIIASARRIWARLAPSEGKRWIAAAHTVAQPPSEATKKALALADAHVCVALEDYDAALVAAEDFERLHGADDVQQLAEARGFAGFALAQLGHFVKGEKLLQNSIVTFERLGLEQLKAQAYVAFGIALLIRGEAHRSRELFRNALNSFRTIQNTSGVGSVAANLAEMEFFAGNVTEAARLAKEAIDTVRPGREARIYRLNLAAYYIQLGRFDEARVLARESILSRGRAWNDVAAALALQRLAAIAALRSQDGKQQTADLESAAYLAGFLDSLRKATKTARHFTEQHEYDTVISALQRGMQSEHYAKLYERGSFGLEEEAIAVALRV